ncbi:ATP-grasp domain-containing protein [Salipaludibacillus sp. CF4.18]|uniref:ATP-grasp domain-containing protein n=1 Tax=Salipaludibacillus sp. CF4.18 TaxID=3373081 RepID=UPI003EE4D62B
MSKAKQTRKKMQHHEKQESKKGTIGIIGWSIPMIEAVDQLKKPYLVVGPPDWENYANKYDIPFVSWDFDKYNKTPMEDIYDASKELFEKLKEHHVEVTVPLFETTVEWSGALNARLKDEFRIFHHSLLFRHKGKMKRRAQLSGLSMGVFEEARNKEDVHEFLKRMNDVLLKQDGDVNEPIHVKAFDKAGDVGHRVISNNEDIEKHLSDYDFPCLLESNLDGVEVSCEVFIHKGKIQFLNITEYVVFGYSMMAPPTPIIEKKRPEIRRAVEQLIEGFEIEFGHIHPEFFITDTGNLKFIEVAYRIPGGNIFDLIQKTYNFNPFKGYILCSDPKTTEEELRNFFPDEKKPKGYAGSLMVYPRVKNVKGLNIPLDLEEQPGFDKHDMFATAERKVPEMEGYGTPDGIVFFHHLNSEHVKQPLLKYVNHNFYV